MPLVTDYNHVRDVYCEAAERGVALPAFCAEDRETLEGILASALEVGREIGVDDLPIVPGWTGRYPARAQACLVSACGDARLGSLLMLSDLEVFAGPDSPYGKLRILPHLDHAYPWLDRDLMVELADRLASVMCDASARPFEDNIRLTREYVEQVRGRVLVEGAADELPEAGETDHQDGLTTVEQAVRFMAETGVDLIVPNVGTEHRATGDQVVYRRERARELSAAVGRVLCLHGTSSVPPEDLAGLADDGFVKVNVFTTLAVRGGQAVARRVLSDLGAILPEAELSELVEQELLGPEILGAVGPRLSALVNAPRRDAWFAAVRDRCRDFLLAFGYQRYAA